MPTILKGKDVTDIAITSAGGNVWQAEVFGASGEMGSRINGGAYTDGVEASSDEQIWLKFDATPDALDFVYGETVDITIDGDTYTIVLDETMIKDVNYYLDDKGVPYTDAAITIFVLGALTEESIGTTELEILEEESTSAEEIEISEETEIGTVDETAETMGVTEISKQEDMTEETSENIGIVETIRYWIGAAASQFTKTTPSSSTSWTKKEGEI